VLRVTVSVRSNEHRHYLIGNDGEERPQQPEEYVGKRIAVHIFDPRNYLFAEDRSNKRPADQTRGIRERNSQPQSRLLLANPMQAAVCPLSPD
jgi:hypothetical protein